MIKSMARTLDRVLKFSCPVGKIKGTPGWAILVYLSVSLSCCTTTVGAVGRGRRSRFAGTLANYSGDVVIGGLFPIHKYDHESKTCGRIQQQDGIQMMEAMLFTLEEINRSGFLPGFTLGGLVADTCDSATVGLERSVEFVRDFTETLSFPGQLSLQCSDGSTPKRLGTGNLDRVVGVVGGAASSISTQIASFLRLFQVPQVSYLSTTPDLSNKQRYGYFLRTVPSDTYQAMAIIQILSRFGWSYVSAVHDDSTYGSELYGEIEKLAPQYGICFAVVRKIRRYPSSPSDDLDLDMVQVVSELTSKKTARVVVVISNYNQAEKLFKAASGNPDAQGLIWIGSDGWSGRESVVKGQEHVVEHAITVQPLGRNLSGFDQYFKRLKPTENTRNPWFKEFWASHFKCHWPESPLNWREQHKELCVEDKEPSTESGYRQFLSLNFVWNAVQVYAHALKNMHRDRCGSEPGLCPAMEVSEITGPDLLGYMENVTFPDSNGQEFFFVNKVDGPPRYSILNYRQSRQGYSWVEIGSYTYEDGKGTIMPPDLVSSNRREYPKSVCYRECEMYEAKKTVEEDKCCWLCVNCSFNQFLPTESECQDCPLGQLPNLYFNACLPIEEVFMKHGQPISIGLSAFSLSGMIVCCLIAAIFFKYRKTPVIKASGIELSYVLLGGVALSYAATLAFVDEPSPTSCAFTRFLVGLCYTVCYAAILIKTNRIARIFHGGEKGAVKTKYTNPKSQIFFLLALTAVELVILIAWTIFKIPTIGHLYPTKSENIRICSQSDDASYLIGLIYPFLLVVLCTIYAVKTRKTPDGFNEARFIAFCAYSTCILWLSFVPIYFSNSDHALRVVTLSLSLSMNATVILVCLFVPKVYIVIFRPHKNTREAVMARTATIRSSDEQSGSKHLHVEQKDHRSSGSASKYEVMGISVISGPRLEEMPKSEEMDHGMDVHNPSTDSGCYVNAGFRDSRVFVDEGISVENVSTNVTNADIEIEMIESEEPKEESDSDDDDRNNTSENHDDSGSDKETTEASNY